MSIRTILVPFGGNCDTPAVPTALITARHLGAHVVGLHVEKEAGPTVTPRTPTAPRLTAGAAMMPEQAVPAEDWTSTTQRRDQTAETVRAGFRLQCESWQMPFLDTESKEHSDYLLPSATFIRRPGEMPHVVESMAHTVDLVVTEGAAVSKSAKDARNTIDSVLLRSGRPVLLAPFRPPEHLQGRVMVAWIDSPQCWRALSTALPFLAKAEDVLLFQVGADIDGRLSEERAANYLAWHGIKVDVVQEKPGPAGVADFLLAQCGERQVGLMVMGAYSHNPFLERLLGGVTYKVLENAAATPVLMVN